VKSKGRLRLNAMSPLDDQEQERQAIEEMGAELRELAEGIRAVRARTTRGSQTRSTRGHQALMSISSTPAVLVEPDPLAGLDLGPPPPSPLGVLCAAAGFDWLAYCRVQALAQGRGGPPICSASATPSSAVGGGVAASLSSLARSRGGTGVGTACAFPAPLTRMARDDLAQPRSFAQFQKNP
jgi:hypothetical protein